MSTELTLRVVDALTASGIPFMLVGSFSSNLYGVERATADADFVVDLAAHSILDLRPHLPAEIRIDPQLQFETVTLTRKYEAAVEGSNFRFEFFLLSQDPFHQSRFQRRVPQTVEGKAVYYPTAEDVLIQKIRWLSIASRPKDWQDVIDVLSVQDHSTLDWPYIHKWCDAHGTRELLDEILAEVPQIDPPAQ